MTIRVLGIAGSLRRGSYNQAVLRTAVELAPPGTTLETFDQLGDLPLYNPDLHQVGFPPVVQRLREMATAADAILFVTPEYNFSVTSVLKNAIDWLSRPESGVTPLARKAAGIMGASTGGFGTLRAQLHLRHMLVYLDMIAVNKPEVLIPFARDKFDDHGKLTDEATRGFIHGHLVALARLARQLNAPLASDPETTQESLPVR